MSVVHPPLRHFLRKDENYWVKGMCLYTILEQVWIMKQMTLTQEAGQRFEQSGTLDLDLN